MSNSVKSKCKSEVALRKVAWGVLIVGVLLLILYILQAVICVIDGYSIIFDIRDLVQKYVPHEVSQNPDFLAAIEENGLLKEYYDYLQTGEFVFDGLIAATWISAATYIIQGILVFLGCVAGMYLIRGFGELVGNSARLLERLTVFEKASNEEIAVEEE